MCIGLSWYRMLESYNFFLYISRPAMCYVYNRITYLREYTFSASIVVRLREYYLRVCYIDYKISKWNTYSSIGPLRVCIFYAKYTSRKCLRSARHINPLAHHSGSASFRNHYWKNEYYICDVSNWVFHKIFENCDKSTIRPAIFYYSSHMIHLVKSDVATTPKTNVHCWHTNCGTNRP